MTQLCQPTVCLWSRLPCVCVRLNLFLPLLSLRKPPSVQHSSFERQARLHCCSGEEATSSVFLNEQSPHRCPAELLFTALWHFDWNLSSLRAVALNVGVWKTGKVTSRSKSFSCICTSLREYLNCLLVDALIFYQSIIVRKAHVYGMPTISTCGIPGKALPVHYLLIFSAKQGINTIPI